MGRCRRHPHHIVVGVCAYCLSEHLSVVIERQGYEAANSSSHHLQHSNRFSPNVFAASNPSTVPESPAFVPKHTAPRLPPRLPCDSGFNDASPKASAHQCFSLSFSPQARFKSDFQTPSNVSSPQNQAFPGNYDFIKGEIPRKKKTSFWSFLLRRKAGFYNSCGTAQLRHNHALDQDVTYSDMSDNDWNKMQPLRYRVQNMHPASRDMHSKDRMSVQDRQAHESNTLLSSMYVRSFGRDNAAVRRVSLPQSSASSDHTYLQYPSSQHRYSHTLSPGPITAIGLSPLRYEKGGSNKSPSQGLQSAAHEFGGYVDGHVALSSSWASSIYPQKFRRSKSISGLSDVNGCEPTMEKPTCRSSPDNEATRARPVSFTDEKINASPKFIDNNVINMGQCRSSNKSRHGRSPKDSSSHGFDYSGIPPIPGSDKVSHNPNSEGVLRFEVQTDGKSQHILGPAPSLLSRSRRETVSIECGKANRVSPVMPAAQKGWSPLHDQYVSPRCRDHASRTHDMNDGNVNGGRALRYMPPYQLVEDSSTMPSDDEFCRRPALFDINLTKQRSKSPGMSQALRKMGTGHRSKELPVKEPAFGSHVFAYSTKSWSKALGSMLGIRHGKEQNIKRQAMSPVANYHEIYHGRHHMDEMKDMHNCCHQSHQNADENDEDESDFIDYNQSDLYLDQYPPQQHTVHSARQPLKAHILQARESQVLSGLEEKGPPQQYSFLSRDYSAFTCYFSPSPQAFQSTELGTCMTKQMQVGDANGWMSRASNPLSPPIRAMRGIRGRSGRG